MIENKHSVFAAVQEYAVPEMNGIEKISRLLHYFGIVTTQSRIAGKRPVEERYTPSEVIERPVALRNTRAELFRELKRTLIGKSKTERHVAAQPILAEAHERDLVARQYLRQGEVKINLETLGEQKARYTRLSPAESEKKVIANSKPTIFFIPGISNDLECVGAIIQELPIMSRNTIAVGFPDSNMGSVTAKFADANEKTTDFQSLAEFYKQAIIALLGADREFELWGHSTGSAIAAQILSEPEFQKRVTNAVLLSPASCTEQTSMELNRGVFSEIGKLIKQFRSLGRYTITMGRNATVPKDPPEQRSLKKRIFNSLLKKVIRITDVYKKARVKEGGSITVVSGQKDDITKSKQAVTMFLENDQVKVLDLKEGSHNTPLITPAKILPEIFAIQESDVRQKVV